jgi:beta-glucosidase
MEARADSLLKQMTLEEKIMLVGGVNDFYTRPIPRLGITSLRMSDGPLGVHDYGLTTAYPAGIAVAATWNTAPTPACSGTRLSKMKRELG